MFCEDPQLTGVVSWSAVTAIVMSMMTSPGVFRLVENTQRPKQWEAQQQIVLHSMSGW